MNQFKHKNKIVYILAFLVPFVILNIICFVNKIAPYGENTFMVMDMQTQYIDYLSYFKSVITTENDFLYTFSKNLGGDMLGFSAYYLLSPLNFLLFLFPADQLPSAISLLIITKLSLCGLSFAIMLRLIDKKLGFSSLFFSLAYAFMGYTAIYCWNIMWIDGVILLPLVIGGIIRIVEGKKPFIYIFSLCAALITNYYIGFMLCIFSVIFFLYKIISQKINKPWKVIRNYIFSSLLSGGLSAVILVPTFLALGGGKASFSLRDLTFVRNFDFADIFSKYFPGSIDYFQVYTGLPNIFSGMLVLILVITFFLNKKVSVREKLASAGVFAVLLISFYINALNMVWHGFNLPTGFPYRFSFIFSFFMIYIAYKGFKNFKEGSKWFHLIIASVLIFGMIFVASLKEYTYLKKETLLYSVFLVMALSFCLYFVLKLKGKSVYVILAAILLLNGSDMTLNMSKTFNAYTLWDPLLESEYSEYYNTAGKFIKEITDRDKDFYRVEKNFGRSHNDPMQFDFAGLSHFSSSEKTFVKDFLGEMGFKNNGNWAYYNYGSTTAVDSLLGVKYLFSQNEYPGFEKEFSEVSRENGIICFENKTVLPIGFMANIGIKDIHIYDDKNIFESQNIIYKSMVSDIEKDIFTAVEYERLPLLNLTEEKEGEYTRYNLSDLEKEGVITYKIKATKNETIYMFIPANGLQNVEIFVNDVSLGDYFSVYQWNIKSIGRYNPGEEIEFKVKLNDASIVMGEPLFYYESVSSLKEYSQRLSLNSCNIKKIRSSYLEGTFKTDKENQLVMMSVPCEKNWHIKVDGKKVENITLINALTGVEVKNPGEHTITMQYIPGGLYPGAVISGVSLILLVIWFVVLYKNERKGK